MKIVIEIKSLYVYYDSDTLRVILKIFKRDIKFTIKKELKGLNVLLGQGVK